MSNEDRNSLDPQIDTDSLEFLSDVSLELKVVWGQKELTIGEILNLKKGSVIVFDDRATDSGVKVQANGNHVADAEIVVVNDHYGVRVTGIKDPESS